MDKQADRHNNEVITSMKKRTQESAASSDEAARKLAEELAGRQQFSRGPKRIADVLSRLVARKGYGRLQATAEFQKAWAAAAGETLAKASSAGNIRRGKLEVIVENSAVAQELQFNKQRILKKLKTLLVDSVIHDLRFRVGAID